MKTLKKFYNNNRIYCILMGISIFCIAIIAVLFIVYFVNQTKNDKYGDRLNGIDSVLISDEHKNEIIDAIKTSELVDSARVSVKGKIIYITIVLKDGKVSDAETLAVKSLASLSEDEKNFYDINFSFTKDEDETFPLLGYKKSDATIISWSNKGSDE